MKKLVSLLLVLVLCLSVSAAVAEQFGLGSFVEASTPKDASIVDGDKYDGSVTFNTIICALVLGDDGKIVSAQFDAIQSKAAVDTEGKFTAATNISKNEAKDAYGMKARATAGEWYEQAAAFGAWCVGKTVDEVLAVKTYERDANHTAVPEAEDLKTTVTIDIGGFLEALKLANANVK